MAGQNQIKRAFKLVVNGVCWVCVLIPLIVTCLEPRIFKSERIFLFFAHSMSLLPGILGECIRRAYYSGVLEDVGANLVVGFGSFFTHRTARIGNNVWIGQYSIIGRASIEANVLVGDHVSILSGRHQHIHNDSGNLLERESPPESIRIGAHSWIGAGATVMADIGEGAIVGAGAIVARAVSPKTVVVGNPATVIKRM